MQAIICGGRDFDDPLFFRRIMDGIRTDYPITHIIEGGARGADRLARHYGKLCDIRVTTVNADWERWGKRAGPIRNEFMLRHFKPELVVAFPGGKGTAHMVAISRKAGVKVIEVTKERT